MGGRSWARVSTPPECLTEGLAISRQAPSTGARPTPDRETFGRADGGVGDPPNQGGRRPYRPEEPGGLAGAGLVDSLAFAGSAAWPPVAPGRTSGGIAKMMSPDLEPLGPML